MPPRPARRIALSVLTVLAALAVLAPVASADDVLSPISARVLDAPQPVLGADGRVHLAYEIQIANQSGAFVDLRSVAAVDARGRSVGATLSGRTLGSSLALYGSKAGTTLAPGTGGILFMDVQLKASARPPAGLSHRFTLDMRQTARAKPVRIAFTGGAPTTVARGEPVEIGPPVRGANWFVANGCCASITAHRGATLSINGNIHVAERFAIDYVQLIDAVQLFSGPIDMLSSYRFFGADILSVANGRVVGVQDGLPEQVPGKLPEGATVQTAGGNYVVVDIGRGRFAFYAHLQPGSLAVKRGDRVRAGQVLGKLGNSGNTDGPHLHFHIMDGPSPLLSNGLPFVTSFTGQGVVSDEAALFRGDRAGIDRTELAGRFTRRLPLDEQVIAFP